MNYSRFQREFNRAQTLSTSAGQPVHGFYGLDGFSPIGYYCFLLIYLPLAKVFWKGEFEGKNLFFKKGFPLILFQLEKTFPKKGASLLATESFFKAGEAPILSILK